MVGLLYCKELQNIVKNVGKKYVNHQFVHVGRHDRDESLNLGPVPSNIGWKNALSQENKTNGRLQTVEKHPFLN
jgi:hypothetical protein